MNLAPWGSWLGRMPVPAAFTPAQMSQLARTADARMVLAARVRAGRGGDPVPGRRAGAAGPVPQRPARRGGADVRRDGCPPPGHGRGPAAGLPGSRRAGVPDRRQWDGLGEDWLEQALAYAAVPCKGARGPLTRLRPRPARPAAHNRGDQPWLPLQGRCTGSRTTWTSTAGRTGRPDPPGGVLVRGRRPRRARRPGRARRRCSRPRPVPGRCPAAQECRRIR